LNISQTIVSPMRGLKLTVGMILAR
jgi:hypothetical protein